jgi:putative transposase
MVSIARDTTRNVKRWRDGKMIKRWCAAGMRNAARSFRRLKGYRRMPTLVAALARHVEAVTPACDAARVAGADYRTPTAQWSRLEAGRSDDLGPKS